MAEKIGSFSSSNQDGTKESNFNIRTPSGGLPVGPLNFSGNYFLGSSERTPEALGMPSEFVRFMQEKGTPVENLEIDESSYNVGIAAHLPGKVLPEFMEKVLRPEKFNVSYGQSKQEVTTPFKESIVNTNRQRGIGGQGQILRGMFGNNAPKASFQYFEPNTSDRMYSGSVETPVGPGILSLSGQKSFNEERPDNYNARLGYRINF
jgi:hypothetical protein